MNRWTLVPLLCSLLVACGDDPAAKTSTASAPAAVADHAADDGHDHAAEAGEHAHEEEAEAGEHGEHDHEEGEPDFAKIEPSRAAEIGVVVATAGSGPVDEFVTLTGRLIIDPRRVAAVRARFPGPVVAVHKGQGDAVEKGESLADVESNESLTVYRVVAPLSGVVLARDTNVGDVAGNDPLFTVGDVSAVQAELQAFSATQAALRVGDSVQILVDDRVIAGRIASVAPELESRTQARRLRVSLKDDAGTGALPGRFVTGRVRTGSDSAAAVAVPVDAVRRLENREVVFIPEEDGFRARPVKVGRRGLTNIEILEGLDAGEQYASAGVFVLKAEIGKNLAAHEH